MALKSMTGFARHSGQTGDFQWTWELKSVNGRGFDARFRVPSIVDGIDLDARKQLNKSVSRGFVNANLEVIREGAATEVVVNEDALGQLIELAGKYAGTEGIIAPSLDGLMSIRGIVEIRDQGREDGEDTLAGLRSDILTGLGETASALVKAREGEGAALAGLLSELLGQIEDLVARAASCDGVRLETIRDRLAARVADLVSDNKFDPQRLEQEVAVLAVKADIREELDRLKAHIGSARDLLAFDGPVGRKLDFLCQEFNREANTLCSKSGDVELTGIGLELKAVIDQFREQVQNVE